MTGLANGNLSFTTQNLLASGITGTPGLSIRASYGLSLMLATGLGYEAGIERDLFQNLSPGWNSVIGIGILSAELYLFEKSKNITPFLRRIDYPDYFEKF